MEISAESVFCFLLFFGEVFDSNSHAAGADHAELFGGYLRHVNHAMTHKGPLTKVPNGRVGWAAVNAVSS